MNSLNKEQLGIHVQILGWLRILSAALLAVVGVGLLIFLGGMGVFAGAELGELIAFWVLGLTGVFVGGLMVVLALPGFIAGVGLLKHKGWGRILAIIVAAFDLINFPIGTAISVYSFYVLFQNSADGFFAGSPPSQTVATPTDGALVASQ